MERNSIKIISNEAKRTVSYWIKNEADKWVPVDRSSPLSRKEYTETSLRESAEKIMKAIDDTYNTCNRGVDLEIKCTDDELRYLSELIAKNYSDIHILGAQKEPTGQSAPVRLKENIEKASTMVKKNDAEVNVLPGSKEPTKQPERTDPKEDIEKVSTMVKKNDAEVNVLPGSKEPTKQPERTDPKEDIEKVSKNGTEQNTDILYKQNTMHVAFFGQTGSGKTTLITALAERNNIFFSVSNEGDYTLYQNMEKGQLWYEGTGIDIGRTDAEKAKTMIKRLIHRGVDVLVYCFYTNKIDTLEKNILCSMKNDFSNVRILAVLTSCVDEDTTVYVDWMSHELDGIKVLPVLAKDMKTRYGIIPSYGIDDISRFIYGGK